MTNSPLDNLWINASDRQPIPGDYSSLIGKYCRYFGKPCVIINVGKSTANIVWDDESPLTVPFNEIQWFDDSPEAVEEWLSEIREDAFCAARETESEPDDWSRGDRVYRRFIDFEAYENELKEQDNHKQQDNG
jgi:hypothetical protein